MTSSPSTLSPIFEREDMSRPQTYPTHPNCIVNPPIAPTEQNKRQTGYPYPSCSQPVHFGPGCYPVDAFGRPLYFGPNGIYPPVPPPMLAAPPLPLAQPYPIMPAPVPPQASVPGNAYNSYIRPGLPSPPRGAYTYPSSPASSRSASPFGSEPARPSSIRSITPPSTPPPILPLTPSQFIHELQQIRLRGSPPGPVGRFPLLGETQPVSVSQARRNGPFLIQHYLPDGRADVISIAHVFEFECGIKGGERGVIVWCPPPKVQYYGMGA
ncbi:hypothetical protein FRC12_020306 [Ceratobasidium sp. 428]|nr:hypothetical protein FRC12_020306 [Ceratobasidium sp. 428]